MTRITITTETPYGPPKIEGWFDPDKSDHYPEERTEDLEGNRTGVCSGSRWVYESLYRTPGGRWVHRVDGTSHFDGRDEYRFVDPDQAQAWLLRSGGHDEALERWFGTAEEEGPTRGRPRVGDPIQVAFPADLLVDVDAAAAEAGMSRAEWIRQACTRALLPRRVWSTPTSDHARHYPGGDDDLVAVLAEDDDQAMALCWVGWRDGEPRITLGVVDGKGAVEALTDNAEDWDVIERVIPRESWPREMYAGKRVPRHDAPADLRALLDAEIAQYCADDDEE